jgi:hypothetical protein
LIGQSDSATIGTETDRHDKTANLREVFGLKLQETQHLRIAQPATVRWVGFFMGQHLAEFNGGLVPAFLQANRGWGYCAWTCYRGRNGSIRGIMSGLYGGPA